jgi:hypothetical protein
MSKYRTVKVQFQSAEALRATLQDVCEARGIAFEEHAKAQPLYGWQGKRRSETAEFIIRRNHVGNAANDLGFKRQADGSYAMIISDFDRRQHVGLAQDIRKRYVYRYEAAKAAELGYEIAEEIETEDGVQLVFARAY